MHFHSYPLCFDYGLFFLVSHTKTPFDKNNASKSKRNTLALKYSTPLFPNWYESTF